DLIVSAFSSSLLIVLIIAKWYVQTGGKWHAEEPPEPPNVVEEPVPEGMATVDGWGSEDAIAKKLEQKVAEWEKSRPDPRFVTVSKKEGAANFTSIREALMAVESGGNVEGSRLDEEADVGGVKILGHGNLPGRVPLHASQMISSNLGHLVEHGWDAKAGAFTLRLDDEILRGCLVTHGGEIVNEMVKQRMK
ncbi:MAG: hypothetical protein KJ726_01255, partial [Verrucomicrobia bacterium]|nr:hypothetical protein [Verrucomicrobiota bacterium]